MICFPGILPLKGVKFFFGVSVKYISTTTKIVDFSIESRKLIEQIVQHLNLLIQLPHLSER